MNKMNKKSVTKKTNRKKLPVKKSTVKRPVKSKAIKNIQIPELSFVSDGYGTGSIYTSVFTKNAECESTKKQRNFWDLFSKVKNHNWRLMIQKGNYLDEFIKLVEEMPEEQFRFLFIEQKDDKTIHTTKKVECECKEPCFCESTIVVNEIGKYSEYIKTNRLERYDVEIQHLRHLIYLQEKGKIVPTSYNINEFLKRSGVKKETDHKPYGYEKPAYIARVVENVQKQNDRLHEHKNFDMEKIEEWAQKYPSKDPVINRSKEFDTRPSLQELAEVVAAKKHSIENALKIVNQYASEMDDVSNVSSAPEVKNSLPSLPKFWQELDVARKQFESFDNFYANKQAELILATRSIRVEKKILLNAPNEQSHITFLKQEIKRYLKAKRDFEVVKKVLKLAYKEFDKLSPTQVAPEFLKAEMAQYTAAPSIDALAHVFDRLSPTPEVYDRVVGGRIKNLKEKGYVDPEIRFSALPTVACISDVSVNNDVKIEKTADAIQHMVLKNWIDPEKDFPDLIKNGIDCEGVEKWKEKYQNKLVSVSGGTPNLTTLLDSTDLKE